MICGRCGGPTHHRAAEDCLRHVLNERDVLRLTCAGLRRRIADLVLATSMDVADPPLPEVTARWSALLSGVPAERRAEWARLAVDLHVVARIASTSNDGTREKTRVVLEAWAIQDALDGLISSAMRTEEGS